MPAAGNCVVPFDHLSGSHHFIDAALLDIFWQLLAVIRKSSSDRQSSSSHQAVIRQSSCSHQAVIRQTSGSHQVVVRMSTGSCHVLSLSSLQQFSGSLCSSLLDWRPFSVFFLHNTRPRTVISVIFWTRNEQKVTFESLPPFLLCTCAQEGGYDDVNQFYASKRNHTLEFRVSK